MTDKYKRTYIWCIIQLFPILMRMTSTDKYNEGEYMTLESEADLLIDFSESKIVVIWCYFLMLGNYFYHEIIRKTVIAFGTLFNDIHVRHDDGAGNVISEIKVPIAYEHQDKSF